MYVATASAQFYTVCEGKTSGKTKKEHSISVRQITDNSSSVLQPMDYMESRQTAPTNKKRAKQIDSHKSMSYPLRKIVVTSLYGVRTDPFTKKKAKHNGLDLKANYEPAYAMFYGKIIKVGCDKRSGKYVTLQHGNITISYCHLSNVIVTTGSIVHPGEIIAVTGNTGHSSGPHLHLTCKKNDGKTINPTIILYFIQKKLRTNTL